MVEDLQADSIPWDWAEEVEVVAANVPRLVCKLCRLKRMRTLDCDSREPSFNSYDPKLLLWPDNLTVSDHKVTGWR